MLQKSLYLMDKKLLMDPGGASLSLPATTFQVIQLSTPSVFILLPEVPVSEEEEEISKTLSLSLSLSLRVSCLMVDLM